MGQSPQSVAVENCESEVASTICGDVTMEVPAVAGDRSSVNSDVTITNEVVDQSEEKEVVEALENFDAEIKDVKTKEAEDDVSPEKEAVDDVSPEKEVEVKGSPVKIVVSSETT